MTAPQRWAILGGGTAGPAAAILLARAGHEVVLFERVADPAPVGAGILLQPTGMAVLARLGLLQSVVSAGARVERLWGANRRGRVVLDLAYGDLRPGLFGLGILRGALFSALWSATAGEARVERRLATEVATVDERSDGVWVAGERFDRVAVATGARAALRPPGAVVRAYPWGALWTVATADPHPGVLYQRYRDTREMAGLLPSGRGRVSLFWSLRADALPAWRAEGLTAWKERVHALLPEAPLDAITDADQVVFAPYFDVVAPRWHTERVVWLGDAAHAMSPQLGQGANLALQDAAALAEVVAAGAPLSAYTAARARQVRFYSRASRLLTPFFQSSLPILAPARDLVAGPLHAWGWYRHQMLASLAGIKLGIWSELPLVDPGDVLRGPAGPPTSTLS